MFFRRLTAAALLVTTLPAAAHAAWTEARSEHFIIYSEQRPAELKQFTEELERYDAAVRQLRGMSDPELSDASRIRIYVLSNQQAVARMAGAPGSGIAGFYMARASGPISFVHRERTRGKEDLAAQTVFFHEYLHHLMLSATEVALPLWVTEGAAEFFASAKFEKDGAISFGHAPQHRSFGLYNFGDLSIEEMVGATKPKLTSIEYELIYGRGWLLTHYLTLGAPNRKNQLAAYIKGIQSGQPALKSATAAFGDLKQLDRELERYLAANRFNGLVVPAAMIKIEPVTLRTLSKGEGASIPVRMQSERGVNKKTAKGVLADAQRAAARFPNEPEVLTALAEAQQDAGDDQGAIATADRALAAAPNNQRALVMKSRALLSIAEKAPAKADWKAIREVIGRANRIDPDAAEPLMLFYRSYQLQGVAPTRNAVEGLMYALSLVPQDRSLRLLAVRQAIADNKLADARRLFGPIAYNPHAGKQREKLSTVMTALNAGDAAKARDLLNKLEQEEESEEG